MKIVTKRYRKTKQILRQTWIHEDEYHREDGPADLWFYEDGSPWRVAWYKAGELHREDGPAWTWYWEDGRIVHRWYVNGELVKEERINAS